MPVPVRVVSALVPSLRPRAVDLLFEYMASTQGENGQPLPTTIAGLPDPLRRECERPERSYADPGALLVARVADQVVGCVGLRPVSALPGAIEVKRLYVRPSHRGSGVARALMTSAHEHAARVGFARTVLDVMPSRTAVIEFYRRLCYTDTAPFTDWPFPMVYLERTLP
jgi:ribosomal protein S18 acetylase RimI-like enzyme